jgi:hypothetical protein
MGKRFELRKDHSALKYPFEQPTLNAMKTRWLEFLSEYNFDINHMKGKENKVVGALSRRVHLMHATTFNIHQSDLKRRILNVFFTYHHYLQGKEILRKGDVKKKVKDYEMKEDGLLMH